MLTGDFAHGEKAQVAAFIEQRGGVVRGKVSGKTSYVVVGSLGSGAYAYGAYSTKVKKAMQLQEQGKPVSIITEDQLYA